MIKAEENARKLQTIIARYAAKNKWFSDVYGTNYEASPNGLGGYKINLNEVVMFDCRASGEVFCFSNLEDMCSLPAIPVLTPVSLESFTIAVSYLANMIQVFASTLENALTNPISARSDIVC
jgi:hypothetical protein